MTLSLTLLPRIVLRLLGGAVVLALHFVEALGAMMETLP